jgi:hypothetical protein
MLHPDGVIGGAAAATGAVPQGSTPRHAAMIASPAFFTSAFPLRQNV